MSATTKRRGRPKIHPDRKAYKAMKEREYRAKRRASSPKPIPQNTIEKEEK